MLERKWYIPFSVAVLVHLIVLSMVITFSYQQPSEPEYMEMMLTELVSPSELADSPADISQPSGAVAEPDKSVTEPEFVKSPVIQSSANKIYVYKPVVSESIVQPPVAGGNPDGITASPATAGNGEGNDAAVAASGGRTAGSWGGTAGQGGAGNGGGATRGPKIIASEEPYYPDIARQNGWEGTVRLRVLVSDWGTVEDVQVAASSGYSQLDQSALTCIFNTYRFSPALVAGKPVTKWVVFAVKFRLE